LFICFFKSASSPVCTEHPLAESPEPWLCLCSQGTEQAFNESLLRCRLHVQAKALDVGNGWGGYWSHVLETMFGFGVELSTETSRACSRKNTTRQTCRTRSLAIPLGACACALLTSSSFTIFFLGLKTPDTLIPHRFAEMCVQQYGVRCNHRKLDIRDPVATLPLHMSGVVLVPQICRFPVLRNSIFLPITNSHNSEVLEELIL
jgi:hypothetical protein